jgi:L-lactate dehydrogenase complex protein LldG
MEGRKIPLVVEKPRADELERAIAMSGDRERVFRSVQSALKGLGDGITRAELPGYDDESLVAQGRLDGHDSLLAAFEAQLLAVHGRCLHRVEDLVCFLKDKGHKRGCCDPELREPLGEKMAQAGLQVDFGYDRDRYDEYQFGITVGSGAIAETGTLILNDEQTFDRLAALTPWVHVAVLSEEQVVRTVADGIVAFGDSCNVIWCTGPSKTADVEGILIEGVHGPGEQIVLFL